MTIKEAKAAQLIISQLPPMSAMLLPVYQQKAIEILRKSVEKKAKKYPKYFE